MLGQGCSGGCCQAAGQAVRCTRFTHNCKRKHPLSTHTPIATPQPTQILRRETVRYDDQRGPAVLTVILLAVFLLSYVLALVWMF